MTDRIRQLASVVRALDRTSLEDFRARLVFQKRVYLLQQLGADLGYRYNWYLRGPYAPDLTRDAFLLARTSQPKSGTTPSAATAAAIKRLKRWAGHRFNDARWLELAASLHYLMSAKIDSAAVRKAIQRKMPSVGPRELAAATNEVRTTFSIA